MDVSPPIVIPTKSGTSVALMQVYPTTSPQAAATTDLIYHLRQTTIPAAVAGTGLTVYVGGTTAIFADFAHVLSSKLPLFVGLVVLLSFLLLAAVFRSLVIPLTAAVMNLLSIAARLRHPRRRLPERGGSAACSGSTGQGRSRPSCR